MKNNLKVDENQYKLSVYKTLSLNCPDMEKTFGAQLEEWIGRAGYKRPAFAEKVGITNQHLGNLIRGRSTSSKSGKIRVGENVLNRIIQVIPPSIATANEIKLAAGYAPSVSDRELQNELLNSILRDFESLPDEKREIFNSYIRMMRGELDKLMTPVIGNTEEKQHKANAHISIAPPSKKPDYDYDGIYYELKERYTLDHRTIVSVMAGDNKILVSEEIKKAILEVAARHIKNPDWNKKVGNQ